MLNVHRWCYICVVDVNAFIRADFMLGIFSTTITKKKKDMQ